MEGLRPPPKAEYNFPNKPDINKFWGTPTSRGFFRSVAVMLTLSTVIWGSNFYFTRHDKGPFGLDISKSKEEMEEEATIKQFQLKLKPYELPIDVRGEQTLAEGRMKFDDGVEFRPR